MHLAIFSRRSIRGHERKRIPLFLIPILNQMKEDPLRYMEILFLLGKIHLHRAIIISDFPAEYLQQFLINRLDPRSCDILCSDCKRNRIQQRIHPCLTDLYFCPGTIQFQLRRIRQTLEERRRNLIQKRSRRRKILRPSSRSERIKRRNASLLKPFPVLFTVPGRIRMKSLRSKYKAQ